MSKTKETNTKRLVISAIFIAVSVVLNISAARLLFLVWCHSLCSVGLTAQNGDSLAERLWARLIC